MRFSLRKIYCFIHYKCSSFMICLLFCAKGKMLIEKRYYCSHLIIRLASFEEENSTELIWRRTCFQPFGLFPSAHNSHRSDIWHAPIYAHIGASVRLGANFRPSRRCAAPLQRADTYCLDTPCALRPSAKLCCVPLTWFLPARTSP